MSATGTNEAVVCTTVEDMQAIRRSIGNLRLRLMLANLLLLRSR